MVDHVSKQMIILNKYLKKYQIADRISHKAAGLTWVFCVIGTWGLKMLLEFATLHVFVSYVFACPVPFAGRHRLRPLQCLSRFVDHISAVMQAALHPLYSLSISTSTCTTSFSYKNYNYFIFLCLYSYARARPILVGFQVFYLSILFTEATFVHFAFLSFCRFVKFY